MSMMTSMQGVLVDDPELDVAQEIQSAYVPAHCRGWPGVRVVARRIASPSLGGDFHNVLHAEGERCCLIVGRLTHSGLSACFAKAFLSGEAAKLSIAAPSPADVIERLDRSLMRINGELKHGGIGCSVFHAVVDAERGRLEYCNAGALRPLVVTADGALQELAPTGPLLGAGARTTATVDVLSLAQLERLVVPTDGVVAAPSPEGEPFFETGGRQVLEATMGLDPEEQVTVVLDALRRHVGRDYMFTEDATLIVTDFHAEAAHARSLDSMQARLSHLDSLPGWGVDPSIYLP